MKMEKRPTDLSTHLPEKAITAILSFQKKYNFDLKITADRVSKSGDYRAPYRGMGHRISVNRGLNKYAFLITLVHEIAHLITWERFKNRVKAHGPEWQNCYRDLLQYFIHLGAFPGDIVEEIQKGGRVFAAACSDRSLMHVLRKYDENVAPFLEELEEGARFRALRGRIFRKGALRRTRYICTEEESGRKYLFSKVARVEPLS